MRRVLRPMMDAMRPRMTAMAGVVRVIGAVPPPIESQTGAKWTMTTALALVMGPCACMKGTIPGLQDQ
jgi:hypothetical protein